MRVDRLKIFDLRKKISVSCFLAQLGDNDGELKMVLCFQDLCVSIRYSELLVLLVVVKLAWSYSFYANCHISIFFTSPHHYSLLRSLLFYCCRLSLLFYCLCCVSCNRFCLHLLQ